MKKKYELLKVSWSNNEYFDVNIITLVLTDEKYAAIEKAQKWLQANPEMDSVCVEIPVANIANDNSDEFKIGFGHVYVTAGTALYFRGYDKFDSRNMVETEAFKL